MNGTANVLNTTALMQVKDVECCRFLLIHGAQINKIDRHGYNAITSYMSHSNRIDKDLCFLLYAAGETTPEKIESRFPSGGNKAIKVADYLPRIQFNLKYLCREAIRKRLLNLDPHTHLFGRIPQLGLPHLTKYLLYNMSLFSSSPPDNDGN